MSFEGSAECSAAIERLYIRVARGGITIPLGECNDMLDPPTLRCEASYRGMLCFPSSITDGCSTKLKRIRKAAVLLRDTNGPCLGFMALSAPHGVTY